MLHMGPVPSRNVLRMTEHDATNFQPEPTDIYPQPAPAGTVGRRPNGLVVLLLEDEPLISMDIEMTLNSAGFEVFTIMSRKDAHAWLDRCSPDVVIVDVQLRDGRCTDVVSRLLEAKIPFIVHSGDDPGMHAGTPFTLGSWVSKPATPQALVRAANAAVARQARLATSLAPA